LEQLYKRLLAKNKAFAEKLNDSDKKNPRRLVRYLEVLAGELSFMAKTKESPYQFLLLGLDCPNDVLQERILTRLKHRLEKEGLVAEVKRLHQAGVSWKRLESFGLEYKHVSLYLQGKLNYDDMVEKLFVAIFQFAKRQKTWWRRWEKQGANIFWIKDLNMAKKRIDKFLSL
jgi:tRNA dimethylallyltransferase